MRWNKKCNIDKTQWHPHFFWFPRKVYQGNKSQWVWWEWVERKRNYWIDGDSYWNIRPGIIGEQ